MAYEPTVFENLSAALSPVIRKLSDVATNLLGQRVQLIRIYTIADDINDDGFDDLLGDSRNIYQSQIVNNVRIQLPASEIEIFPTTDSTNQSAESISIMDLLPIVIDLPFEGARDEDIIELDTNDILVAVMQDYKGNKISLVLQSPKQVSGFFGKYEIARKYECTLYRGTLEPEIQVHVDNYITSLGTPEVESTTPADGATGFSVSGDIVVQFNTSMDESTTIPAVDISPAVTTTNEWDLYSGQLTMSPTTDLTSGTTYTITIDEAASSMGGITLEEDYTFDFTTE